MRSGGAVLSRRGFLAGLTATVVIAPIVARQSFAVTSVPAGERMVWRTTRRVFRSRMRANPPAWLRSLPIEETFEYEAIEALPG
jgi:hypothetical protein